MKLQCQAIQATTDPYVWQSYVDGHAQVLRDFGIEILTSYGKEWINNPNVYVITTRDESGSVVGGIKIHKVHPQFKLPVEHAIGDDATDIHKMVAESAFEGCGEICGLWISNSAGKRGLAHYLAKVAIALCEPLGIKTIYGISSPFTLNMFFSLGYERLSVLGKNGDFDYPTPEFLSTAVIIRNTYELPLATDEHRSRVFSLRQNPVQTYSESHQGIVTEISYNLSNIFA